MMDNGGRPGSPDEARLRNRTADGVLSILLSLECRHIKGYQSHINKEGALPSLVNEPIALWFDAYDIPNWQLAVYCTALSTTSNDCRFHSHIGLSTSQHDESNHDGIPASTSSFHPVQLKLDVPNPAPPKVDALILARPVSVSNSQHGQLAESSSDCLAQLFTRLARWLPCPAAATAAALGSSAPLQQQGECF